MDGVDGAWADPQDGADAGDMVPACDWCCVAPGSLACATCGAPTSVAANQYYLLNSKYQCFNAVLGVGQSGVVRPGVDLHSGLPVAIKVLDRAHTECSASRREALRREITVSMRLQHPNIIRLQDVVVDRSKIHLCLEMAEGGELLGEMQRRGRVPEHEARELFAQLISAIDYCHSQSVCHRDLKLENIMLSKPGSNTLKVTDFGFSKDYLNESLPKTKRVGTLAYMAPEVALDSSIHYDGNLADLWACGVILFILVTGKYPFGEPLHDKPTDIYRRIVEGDYMVPDGISPGCSELISSLLVIDPRRRASLDFIKAHHWFTGICFVPVPVPAAPSPEYQWPDHAASVPHPSSPPSFGEPADSFRIDEATGDVELRPDSPDGGASDLGDDDEGTERTAWISDSAEAMSDGFGDAYLCAPDSIESLDSEKEEVEASVRVRLGQAPMLDSPPTESEIQSYF